MYKYILDYCICFKTFYKSLSMHANFEFYPSKISIWTGQKPFDDESAYLKYAFLMQNCENKFGKSARDFNFQQVYSKSSQNDFG